MSASAFDTLDGARRLKAASIESEQAEVMGLHFNQSRRVTVERSDAQSDRFHATNTRPHARLDASTAESAAGRDAVQSALRSEFHARTDTVRTDLWTDYLDVGLVWLAALISIMLCAYTLLSLVARVANARLTVRVDIGFGDAVTPGVQEIEFPSLLDMPTPGLRAYPPETVVAEKFQAIVALGMLNSRMKDFFDLWAIAETFSFDGTVLAEAIRATFDRRQTDVPVEAPIALTPAFAEDVTKQAQWRGFLRRTAIDMAPGPFAELQGKVAAFVLPPASAVASGTTFGQQWEVGGGWR